MAQDWYDSEPSLRRRMTRELQRLVRRARKAPLRILVVTSLLTAMAVWYIGSKGAVYNARVILKVEESEVSEEREPLPMQGLRDYVASLTFTKDNLLTVIEELELFPRRADMGDDWAVASFRENIHVEVYRNFFSGERGYEGAPRSARIAVLYADADPDEAYRITRRLARLVEESERTRRQVRRAEGLAEAEATVEAARERLQAKYTLIGRAGVELSEATGKPGEQAAIRFRIRQLEDSAHGDRDVLRAAIAELRSLEMSHALAAEELGLRFTVVDERIPRAPESRRNFLVMLGVAAFCAFLPICIMTFGAFDSRIHDADDVRRLGFPVVGHMPGFKGDRVGSLRDRSARRDRVT